MQMPKLHEKWKFRNETPEEHTQRLGDAASRVSGDITLWAINNNIVFAERRVTELRQKIKERPIKIDQTLLAIEEGRLADLVAKRDKILQSQKK
jgi:hypothetical protein